MLRKQERKKVGGLLSLFTAGVDQAVRALQARRGRTIAIGVVNQLETAAGDIERTIDQAGYPPAVRARASHLLAELRTKGSSFADAVRIGAVKEAKTVGGWVKDLAGQLAELVGVE